jgi:hypothetical protein
MQRQQRSAKTFQYRLGLLCLCWLALGITATAQSWPQWGGPQRNLWRMYERIAGVIWFLEE